MMSHFIQELQSKVDGWNQEAARLEAYNETEYDQCFYFQYKGEIKQLRKCAGEAASILIKITTDTQL